VNQLKYVGLYLGAIVLANLSSATFGVVASIINAFLFIGLDLSARDKLHEAWSHDYILLKMSVLIAAGSALSWFIDRNAGQIAIASCLAFGAAALTDTMFYHLLRDKAYLLKVNGSNIPSALVDSLIFPTVAFGSILPLVMLGQFAAKVLGGFVWSVILRRLDCQQEINWRTALPDAR
jgi:hypothetical protein